MGLVGNILALEVELGPFTRWSSCLAMGEKAKFLEAARGWLLLGGLSWEGWALAILRGNLWKGFGQDSAVPGGALSMQFTLRPLVAFFHFHYGNIAGQQPNTTSTSNAHIVA